MTTGTLDALGTNVKNAAARRGKARHIPPRTYWQDNLRLLAVLLAIWFAVSFGFGIVLCAFLDRFDVFGVPAGFWFGQQGSIYVFVALIFFYSWRIRAIERRHGVDDDDEVTP